jgi:dihydroxyacetone kinase
MTDALDVAAVRAALLGACDRLLEARADLTALDAAAGDGDLGESLAIGADGIRATLAAEPGLADVGAVLTAAGTALSRSAPSTFGTLLGMAWRDAGRALKGEPRLTGAGVVTLLTAMEAGVARRGEVTTGQRTVLDAIAASREHAEKAAGGGATAALTAAAEGAREGADRTAGMRPQVGRAGWIAERAMGWPDAGATAWAVIAEALAANGHRGKTP